MLRPEQVRYFDNNATTAVAPEVLEVMLPLLKDHWGNPSSAYTFGNQVLKYIDKARSQLAEMIHAEPTEIIFTSCGTESINSALHHALKSQPGKRHIITTAVEHSATLNYCQFLRRNGCDVTFLPVDSGGQLDLELLKKTMRPDTAVVSVMYANNETGVIFPIPEISAICRNRGALMHADAVQTPGKLKLDVGDLGVDLMSLSAHKLHAPKGIGLLFARQRGKFHPYIIGGHQERNRRGGTENAAGIVAFGKAAELAVNRLADENTRVRALRDRLEKGLLESIPHAHRNGQAEPRLPNTSSLAFDQVEAEAVLMMLDQLGICASSGSACTTGSLDPSHVLTAMGVSAARARGSVRFSLGIYNTSEDVDFLLHHFPKIIQRLRAASPE